jgi:hypothetical protein
MGFLGDPKPSFIRQRGKSVTHSPAGFLFPYRFATPKSFPQVCRMRLFPKYIHCFFGCVFLLACNKPDSQPIHSQPNNHNKCFPCIPYDHIEACRLGMNGKQEDCATLIPAHKADLGVALLLNPFPSSPDAGKCRQVSHAFNYYKGDTVVGTIRIGVDCRFLEFFPDKGWLVGAAGFERMRVILEEMGLVEEN